VTLTKVSFDPTRRLHEELNAAFARQWLARTGEQVRIIQAPQAATSQTRSVIDGLNADMVTLALASDVDSIAALSGKIPAHWQRRLPFNSAPYTSTVTFLVRKGNPRNIRDWDDLVKPGIVVVTPNPKTGGGARWNYLAAWGYALRRHNNNAAAARAFVTALFRNVPELPSGTGGAAALFFERGIGDVLLGWEANAYLSLEEFGADRYQMVVPSISILAEPVVSLVDGVVDVRGTRTVTEAYLQFLYSSAGQEIAARNYFRPRLRAAAGKFRGRFPALKLLTIEQLFGGWAKAQKAHFADGAMFDQIYRPTK
jgi:sulfate transport system substrate-binding protein